MPDEENPETLEDHMTLNWLFGKLLDLCPGGGLGEDDEGQIIFYTNKRIQGTDEFGNEMLIELEE